LANAASANTYSIFLTIRESSGSRDDIIGLVDSATGNTPTTSEFTVIVTEQDNGGTAGQYRDRGFYVMVVE
tara:strand:- start:81 stop:293 length:213 start_codon:yes stop_codon:yes gene_type:complete